MLKKITNNPKLLVIIDQLLYSGMGFISTIALAKILTIQNFGIYSSVVLASYLLISISNAIIIQPFQVATSEFKDSENYSYFLFINQLLFTIITGGLCLICISLIFNFPIASIFNMLLMVSSMIMHDFFRKYYLGSNKLIKTILIDSIQSLIQVCSILYLFLNNISSLNLVFLLIGISYLLSSVFATIIENFNWITTTDFKKYYQYHKKEGVWLTLVAFIQWGASNFFVASLGIYIGIEALGAFRFIQSLFGIINILFQTYENYVLPNATAIYQKSIENSKKYINQITLQGSLIIGIVLFVLFIMAKDIMNLVSDGKYEDYAYILKGMCILYFIIFLGYPTRLCIRMLLLNKHFFIGYLLSFLLSVVSFRFLIKNWELNGVIIGLILNQIIMIIYWNVQLANKNFKLWK